MARLMVDGGHVEVELSSLEKFGALRRSVRYPLRSVTAVRRVEVARSEISGIRAPGTHIPRGVALGTWRKRGFKSFVAVHGHGPGYVIDLAGEDVDRVIVESEPVGALDSLPVAGRFDG